MVSKTITFMTTTGDEVKKITIPAPVANPGEFVRGLNRRTKKFEDCRVFKAIWDWKEKKWSYVLNTLRFSKNGSGRLVKLFVDNKGIRRYPRYKFIGVEEGVIKLEEANGTSKC